MDTTQIAEARQRLNHHLSAIQQKPATDKEWKAFLRAHRKDFGGENLVNPWGDDDDPVQDMGQMAYRLIMEKRRSADGSEAKSREAWPMVRLWDVKPPDWWVEESRHRLGRYSEQRYKFRAVFGLVQEPISATARVEPGKSPLPLSELEPFLERKAAEEPPGGQRGSVRYIVDAEGRPSGKPTDLMIRVKSGGATFTVGMVDVRRSKDTPLGMLCLFTESVGTLLAIDPAEITAWLLCDHEVILPWIEIEAHPRDASDTEEPSITDEDIVLKLVVGTPRVPVKTVAGVYANMQRGLLGHRSIKQPSVWPLRVKNFMSEWRRDHRRPEWKKAYADFKERYPDAPYDGMRSFRQAEYSSRGEGKR